MTNEKFSHKLQLLAFNEINKSLRNFRLSVMGFQGEWNMVPHVLLIQFIMVRI